MDSMNACMINNVGRYRKKKASHLSLFLLTHQTRVVSTIWINFGHCSAFLPICLTLERPVCEHGLFLASRVNDCDAESCARKYVSPRQTWMSALTSSVEFPRSHIQLRLPIFLENNIMTWFNAVQCGFPSMKRYNTGMHKGQIELSKIDIDIPCKQALLYTSGLSDTLWNYQQTGIEVSVWVGACWLMEKWH